MYGLAIGSGHHATLGKPKSFLIEVHGSLHIGDCKQADTAPYCFLLRGSIFFAIVLLIGKWRQSSRADSAGPEMQQMLAVNSRHLHFFACS
jgi:hypothetical protein